VFATKGDDRVWSYDPVASSLEVMYDESVHRGVLSGVDNLRTGAHGAAFVAEDGDDMQVVLVRTDGSTFPVLQLDEDNSSEITGLAFDPSGTRLYFSSQRNPGRTYEVMGLWASYAFAGTLAP
jgi:secreted PhoX family phosphatase